MYKMIKKCSSCEKEVSNDDVYLNDGVCPHCGTVGDQKIVKYYKELANIKETRPIYVLTCLCVASFLLGIALGLWL